MWEMEGTSGIEFSIFGLLELGHSKHKDIVSQKIPVGWESG
jgi:hypothetical protein